MPWRARTPRPGAMIVAGACASPSGCIAALSGNLVVNRVCPRRDGWPVDETAHDHADVVRAAAFVTQPDQALGCFSRRVLAHHAGDVLVRQQAVQAVTAEHDHVAGTQLHRSASVHIDRGLEANAAGDDVAAFAYASLV